MKLLDLLNLPNFCHFSLQVPNYNVNVKLKDTMNRMSAIILVTFQVLINQITTALAGSGEPFSEKGQKQYEEDEEGKIVPHR